MSKFIGDVSAYAYAVSKGYTGTEEEFAELMADYASVGQSAAQSAEQAAASATSASGSAATATQAAQTATSKASEAVTAAGTATTKASEASTSADTASAAATSAITSAQTATTASATATTKASEASESATTATTAKTDAESARDAAAQSASEAAASAESIDPDEFNRKIYAAFATDTSAGAIASFADGADNIPMKDVLVHIEPVQAGSGDPSPDNIRPISGWTGVKVTRTGKNLLPYPYSSNSGTYNGVTFTKYEDGTINCSGTATDTAFFNFKKATESFLLKAGSYVINGAISGSIIVIGDAATNLPVGNTNNNNGNFTLAKDTEVSAYIRVNPGNSVNGIVKPMIRLATESDAEYEPYQGEIYDITFPTEAGTVYGGTLDVTKGELVVDRAMADLGSLNYGKDGDREIQRYYTTGLSTLIKKPSKPSELANIITSCFKVITQLDSWNQDGTVSMTTEGYVFFMTSAYSTVSDFKTAMSDVQLCYELATPIRYPLTPTEIKTLLGQNNIWADCGDVSVEYRADTTLYINKKIAEAVSALS